MSSEVEPSKNPEEPKVDRKRTLKQKINDYWQIGLKVIELLLCVICLIFAYDAVKTSGLGSSHMNHIGIMFTCYTGFLMINILLIINRFFGERMPYKSAAIYALLGSALFMITGILLIVCRTFLMKHYGYTSEMSLMTNLTISLFFAFVNCLLVCATCIALIYDPAQGTRIGKSHLGILGLVYTTYSGFIIINLMFLLSRSIKDRISYKTNIIFSAAGSLMFVLTAALLLKAKADLQPHNFFHPHTHHLVMLLTTVFFSLMNAVLYAFDVFLHCKFKKDLVNNA